MFWQKIFQILCLHTLFKNAQKFFCQIGVDTLISKLRQKFSVKLMEENEFNQLRSRHSTDQSYNLDF